jgi:oligopeptide transport system substrate-binding protein
MYKSGMTDWNPSGYLPVQFIPYVRDKADYRTTPYLGLYYYSANVTDPLLSNIWLRRALAWSIDRETLCRDLLKGSKIPRGNFTPLGFEGYEPPRGIGFDPAYARECLGKAGYGGGASPPKLDIMFNTSEDHKKLAEAIQAMWREHLGIEVELSNQEWGSYLKATTQLNYRVARRSWIGDYGDPNTFLATLVTGDGNNRTGWSNARFDSLIAAANRVRDPKARFAVLSQAEAIVLDELPVLPIYNYMLTELVKPYVKGLYPTSLDEHPLKFVWIDRDWDKEDRASVNPSNPAEPDRAGGNAGEASTPSPGPGQGRNSNSDGRAAGQ